MNASGSLGPALLESAWITARIAAGLGLLTWMVGVGASVVGRARKARVADAPGAAGDTGAAAGRARVLVLAQVLALGLGGALVALTRGEAMRLLPVPLQAVVAAGAALVGPLGGMFGAWAAHALAHGKGLLTGGPFGIVRHPLYLSLVLVVAAAGGALGSLSGTLVACGGLLAAAAWRARGEDRALARTYGAAFAAYAARVRGFRPRG